MLEKVLLIIALFSFATVVAQQTKINSPAPDFTLLDINGKEHKLSEYKGKIVVLEWINFDCPYVKKHYNSKNMQQLQEKYTKQDIIWLAICSSAPGKQGNFTKDEILNRIKLHDAKFNAYLIDEDGKVGKTYGAKTTPHIFIIDKNGNLVYAGGIDDKPSKEIEDVKDAKNYVSKALDELLSGKPVTEQSAQSYGCSVKYND
ncbi:MAG TPA: thioredoxin family protein [Ignavibacteriales bacterium]|mgnify:CR=1 FL=1|nr:thioredoxin family protein [Ignavibacteriales bacterium]HOL82126.1 thioredoxin family protein [Ignavibacteriales bacterium]HOM65772.1 thioredoxin family protein [Ignavibacteriales bacterium]HPD66946.1 thioredoxin family protein [Ignavibacteriales bacterium]HPP34254.1 thioredoxin family protein [Ignavibacteriales bacterium]